MTTEGTLSPTAYEHEVAGLRAQVATLEQLLAAHEAAAADQVRKREAALAELQALLARERERNETLKQLQAAVKELSTPILELWDDVLALPIIGVVDARRSAEMLEQLLDEIVRKRSRFVIIDVTGVEGVDQGTADNFVRMVRSVELLGSKCLLTGIRPGVAQTLVEMGVDLASMSTLRNLQHGLKECLRASGETIAGASWKGRRPAKP